MTAQPTAAIRTALTSKGFPQDNSHHEMYWLYHDGKKTSVRTRISHGATEYGDNLLGQMARQVGLTRPEFSDFIACPMTAARYTALVTERGRIASPPTENTPPKSTHT